MPESLQSVYCCCCCSIWSRNKIAINTKRLGHGPYTFGILFAWVCCTCTTFNWNSVALYYARGTIRNQKLQTILFAARLTKTRDWWCFSYTYTQEALQVWVITLILPVTNYILVYQTDQYSKLTKNWNENSKFMIEIIHKYYNYGIIHAW